MNSKIQSNQHYFKISCENPENFLDKFYIFDERHPDIEKYIANTKDIKNILITIKTLQNKKERGEIIEKYFCELQKILSDFSNCSEFICFVNACDNTLKSVKTDLNLIKKITKKYFSKRTLNEFVPEEWIQAVLDSNSSRKKGKCGEIKLIAMLKGFGFNEIETWDDFLNKKKCVLQFSKKINMKYVREKLNVKIRTKKQNKKLDLIVKSGKRIFLLEAKHLNTSGGGQDKQIAELIEILNLKEKNKDISYVVFLDGNYSNVLLDIKKCGDKLKTQRQEIKKYLRKNSNNYWLNTSGFRALFGDLTK